MEYSEFLGLSLPSRDNDTDIADINVISGNFTKVDDFCKKIDKDSLKKFSNALIGEAFGKAIRIDDANPNASNINISSSAESVDVYGKNICPIYGATVGAENQAYTSELLGSLSYPQGVYTVSCKFNQKKESLSKVSLSVRDFDDWSEKLGNVYSEEKQGELSVTVNINEGKKGFRIYLYSNSTEEAKTSECEFFDVQVEIGSISTKYEAYKAPETVAFVGGKIDGLNVNYPTTSLIASNDVEMKVNYNKDINKAFEQISLYIGGIENGSY